jgi:ferredoxin
MTDQVDHQSTSDDIAITVCEDGIETTHFVEQGSNLRTVLMEEGYEVYGTVSKKTNCRGNGLCATCGVRLDGPNGPPEATHWHDSVARQWGYPRLSCQVTVDGPLWIEIIEKVVWGQLIPQVGISTDD